MLARRAAQYFVGLISVVVWMIYIVELSMACMLIYISLDVLVGGDE